MTDKEKDELTEDASDAVVEAKVENESVENSAESKEEALATETKEDVIEPQAEEVKAEVKEEAPKEKNNKNKKEADEDEPLSKKDEVELKIRKQIEKKQEKDSHFGSSRLIQYIAEEHKWENYVFAFLALLLMVLGFLIINGSVSVREGVPLLGSHPILWAWIFVGIGFAALLFAVWPIYKPVIPEFKKITWLTMPKFAGNLARVFIFMLVFVALMYLYDAFISEIYILIFD